LTKCGQQLAERNNENIKNIPSTTPLNLVLQIRPTLNCEKASMNLNFVEKLTSFKNYYFRAVEVDSFGSWSFLFPQSEREREFKIILFIFDIKMLSSDKLGQSEAVL